MTAPNPCPFCGDRLAVLHERELTPDLSAHAVVCVACQASGPAVFSDPDLTEAQEDEVNASAIAGWNRRVGA